MRVTDIIRSAQRLRSATLILSKSGIAGQSNISAKKLHHSLILNSLVALTNQGCNFLRLIFVAAAVGPTGMGTFAVAASVLAATSALSQLGIRQLYISGPGADAATAEEWLGSAWVGNLLLGLCTVIISLPFGYIAALYFQEKDLFYMVVALAVSMPLSDAINPTFLLQERAGCFNKIVISDIISQATGTATAIIIVILWNSYWALVAGTLLVSLTQVVTSYILADWPKTFNVQLKHIAELFSKGIPFCTIAIMTFITFNLDKILIASFSSEKEVGVFFLTQKVVEVPALLFNAIIGRALLPHFTNKFYTAGPVALWHETRLLLLWTGFAHFAAMLVVMIVYSLGSFSMQPAWQDTFALFPFLLVGVAARSGCNVLSPALIVVNLIGVESRYKLQKSIIYLLILPLFVAMYGAFGAAIAYACLYIVTFGRRVTLGRRIRIMHALS